MYKFVKGMYFKSILYTDNILMIQVDMEKTLRFSFLYQWIVQSFNFDIITS